MHLQASYGKGTDPNICPLLQKQFLQKESSFSSASNPICSLSFPLQRRTIPSSSSSVWPDLAKLHHFGKIFKVLGNFGGFIYCLAKILELLWQVLYAIGQMFFHLKGQMLKNNQAIWSHWSSSSLTFRSNQRTKNVGVLSCHHLCPNPVVNFLFNFTIWWQIQKTNWSINQINYKESIKESGCGSVGRAVASDTRGPRFESSHRQKFINIEHLFTVNCVLKRRK